METLRTSSLTPRLSLRCVASVTAIRSTLLGVALHAVLHIQGACLRRDRHRGHGAVARPAFDLAVLHVYGMVEPNNRHQAIDTLPFDCFLVSRCLGKLGNFRRVFLDRTVAAHASRFLRKAHPEA